MRYGFRPRKRQPRDDSLCCNEEERALALAEPNGGVLINRLETGAAADELAIRASAMPHLELDACSAADLYMIATGGLSPLTGFLGRAENQSVLETMRLPDGTVVGLPVTLPVPEEMSHSLHLDAEICLSYAGMPLGTLTVRECFTCDQEDEAQLVYGTTDTAHPGVARLMAQSRLRAGGPVRMFRLPLDRYAKYRKTPAELRAEFDRRGWRTIVGFQTRNPIHRAHEYIQKCALEIVDGLLLHPLVGETKSDDVPAEVRLRSYEVMLQQYYPAQRVCLATFPAAMRYAGPREAVFHAMCRRNYGCTHFIVGRDHAGVGNYYGTYAAQQIFSQFKPDELGIQPLMFEHTFYCRTCGQMGSAKTCPHDATHHISLSGTKVRAILGAGQAPPPEITRPEVAAVLMTPRATP